MIVEKCEIVYTDSKDKITTNLILDTSLISDHYSLENIEKRIRIFTNRFQKHQPDCNRIEHITENTPDEQIYTFQYLQIEDSHQIPQTISLCDITATKTRDINLGTYINAMFEYQPTDTNDLTNHYKTLSLFCKYCFGTNLISDKRFLQEFETFWPIMNQILDSKQETLENQINEIIETQTQSQSTSLISRQSHYPVVEYKKTPQKKLRKEPTYTKPQLVEPDDLFISLLFSQK